MTKRIIVSNSFFGHIHCSSNSKPNIIWYLYAVKRQMLRYTFIDRIPIRKTAFEIPSKLLRVPLNDNISRCIVATNIRWITNSHTMFQSNKTIRFIGIGILLRTARTICAKKSYMNKRGVAMSMLTMTRTLIFLILGYISSMIINAYAFVILYFL